MQETKPRPDTGIITAKINNSIKALWDLAQEIDKFAEDQILPNAQANYDELLAKAIAELEAEGSKTTGIKEKAKGRIKSATKELKYAEIKKWAITSKLELHRSIISARKAQLGVQDII